MLSRDPSIRLFCYPFEVKQLNREEFLLLEAINEPLNRLNAFEKLQWGVQLKVGDIVSATLPEGNFSIIEHAKAIVRYKDVVEDLPGIHFGLEISVSR